MQLISFFFEIHGVESDMDHIGPSWNKASTLNNSFCRMDRNRKRTLTRQGLRYLQVFTHTKGFDTSCALIVQESFSKTCPENAKPNTTDAVSCSFFTCHYVFLWDLFGQEKDKPTLNLRQAYQDHLRNRIRTLKEENPGMSGKDALGQARTEYIP